MPKCILEGLFVTVIDPHVYTGMLSVTLQIN